MRISVTPGHGQRETGGILGAFPGFFFRGVSAGKSIPDFIEDAPVTSFQDKVYQRAIL
jgi:hypothetical protein